MINNILFYLQMALHLQLLKTTLPQSEHTCIMLLLNKLLLRYFIYDILHYLNLIFLNLDGPPATLTEEVYFLGASSHIYPNYKWNTIYLYFRWHVLKLLLLKTTQLQQLRYKPIFLTNSFVNLQIIYINY